jgi:hypothetical protein
MGRGRTLHLIDIENLVRGQVSPVTVRQAWEAYTGTVGVGPGDQVRVACATNTAACVAFAVPRRLQLLIGGHGRDAADNALIDSVDAAFTARRFATVIIASADHGFAPLAASLGALGCTVHAVHRTPCAAALVMATASQTRLIYRSTSPARQSTLCVPAHTR